MRFKLGKYMIAGDVLSKNLVHMYSKSTQGWA